MRIVGGEFRGRALAALGKGDAGAHLRPTTDRLRETIFNVLAGGRFGDPVPGARVLDLFAGTGALALEALSRGAAEAVLVDDGRKAQALIRQNIDICGAGDRARLVRRDARKLGPNDGAPFDLIFLDPPYGRDMGAPALKAALAGGWIASGALVVWEEAGAVIPPEGIRILDARRYGDSTVTFATAAPAEV